jgi:AcrR family transcriptional regulator
MSKLQLDSGRINQKLRTRKAILQAVSRILKHNPNPSLEEIAQEALISRATIYRYFPKLESLLIEAVLELKMLEPAALLSATANNPIERVVRVHHFLYDAAVENEVKFRQFLKATLSQWLEGKDKELQLRSGRRISMLEEALKGQKASLDEETFQKLVFSLSVMVGIESLIVLRDVCEVSYQDGREIMEWAISQLVTSVLEKQA